MRKLAPRAGVILAALTLVACGSGSGTGQTTSGTPSGNSTATAQPTVKPKPTTLPPVTEAYCQQLLSVAEANQIMGPANPAIFIDVSSLPSGGLCDYLSSQSLTPAALVVQVHLDLYTGAKPITQQQIEAYFQQGLNEPGVTVLTDSAVSGVGDQAGIVVGSYTYQGTTLYGAAFYALYGNVVFDCGNLSPTSPTAAQQGALKQCAETVLGRL
jgi:hypothetical protein